MDVMAIQKLSNLEIELLYDHYCKCSHAITRFTKSQVFVSVSSTKVQTYSTSKKVHPPFWSKDFPPLRVCRAGWDLPMLYLTVVF